MSAPRMMGITAAVAARDLAGMDREVMRAYFQDLAEQMQPRLRQAAGGADPKGSLSVKLDGPQFDPVQGFIFAMTVAAPFDPDDLPVDCDFYVANAKDGGVWQPDQGPLITGTGD